MGGDTDTYTQRGLAYHQSKNFKLAQLDFSAAIAGGESSVTLFNHLGMSAGQLGNVEESLAAYRQEAGDAKSALVHFQRAIDLDTSAPYLQAYSYRSFLHHAMGSLTDAIKDMSMANSSLFGTILTSIEDLHF